MKAHSSFALFSVLLFAITGATGCIAQAGTEDSSTSAEELNAQTSPASGLGAQAQKTTPTSRVRAENGVEKQLHSIGGGVERGIGLSINPGDPGGGGDPVQDPGDGNEPDPHPWHTSTATPANK